MHNEIGQTFIEVLVVVVVGTLVVTALVFAVIFALRSAQFAKNSSQATKLAQEALEKVRSFRDRGDAIDSFTFGIADGVDENNTVDSFKDEDMWDDSISSECSPCYFKINLSGRLQYIGTTLTGATDAEPIPPPPAIAIFHRVIILSDENTGTPRRYTVEKIVTALVQWTDFSGPHESKLTTILRKL